MLADAAFGGASSWALRRSVFLSRLSVLGSAAWMTKLLRPAGLLAVWRALTGCPELRLLATRVWPARLFVLMLAGPAMPRWVFILNKPSAFLVGGVGVKGALGLANNMLLSSRLALPGAGLAWVSAMGTDSWAGSTPANGIAKAKPAGVGIGTGIGVVIGIGIGTGMLDWPNRLLGSNPPALVLKLSRAVALSWP